MTYIEKLKDPRWQKKRLKILERDKFTCQKCHDTKTTLHVHHQYYMDNVEPWDYPYELLITLCEDCHEYEKQNLPDDLLKILKSKGFLIDDISNIAEGFMHLKLIYSAEFTSILIKYLLTSEKVINKFSQDFFNFPNKDNNNE